ncbi:hypothetical protein [Nocardioides coralli]|uniref:hypothetical protein n=1 Tax=Nocardioides coralli TaxID=2872154 RepID=UPI001CA401FB|nr:hypothetical protein [Nocardioides coralli]QZY30088.1 hypothetical protein K6T13_05230 [Nocardioides coralli]
MPTADPLQRSIQHTHDDLAGRLERASAGVATLEEPRKDYEEIDTFLATASRHLGAVDAVLLPLAHQELEDAHRATHDYLDAARHLEVVLAHVKARAYGSVYETGFRWDEVWGDVRAALADHREQELELARRLGLVLDHAELDAVAAQLHHAEPSAPTRPHPYVPHTGFPGLVARKVMHAADLFWDAVEGRMVPTPARPRRRDPGLVAQYFLADPRFDPEEQPKG